MRFLSFPIRIGEMKETQFPDGFFFFSRTFVKNELFFSSFLFFFFISIGQVVIVTFFSKKSRWGFSLMEVVELSSDC